MTKKKIRKVNLDSIGLIRFLSLLVALAGIGLLFWFGLQYLSIPGEYVDDNNVTLPNGKEKTCNHVRKLDGACVANQEKTNPNIVAVMIENHPDSRPQSGLSQASIVYEVPVEANYTRFLAIFPSDQKVEKIGPVRSARPYFLDLISEYGNPLYVHCGGSAEALSLIKQYNVFDLNEFFYGWYYWRAKDRLAPHNVYTSSELLNKAFVDYQLINATSTYTGWTFATSTIQQTDKLITKITASFLPPTYEAVWQYNTSTQKYQRYQTNQLHLDQDGRQIMTDTVIIQKIQTKTIDDIGRKEISMISTGKAIVFHTGQAINGTWEKKSRTDRTRYFDENNKEIYLKPGKIWIEMVPQDGNAKYE